MKERKQLHTTLAWFTATTTYTFKPQAFSGPFKNDGTRGDRYDSINSMKDVSAVYLAPASSIEYLEILGICQQALRTLRRTLLQHTYHHPCGAADLQHMCHEHSWNARIAVCWLDSEVTACAA